jgi:hypothetical protein
LAHGLSAFPPLAAFQEKPVFQKERVLWVIFVIWHYLALIVGMLWGSLRLEKIQIPTQTPH